MNIVIDIGNTRTKAGVFKGDQLIIQYSGALSEVLEELKAQKAERLIVSAVGQGLEQVVAEFESKLPVLVFDHELKIPLRLDYQTPHTLGLDRLAAAIGSTVLMPEKNVLVIDMGSCMTLDFIKDGEVFCGGAISPGMNMRFKAMHHFTHKLPLIDYSEMKQKELIVPGKSTQDCMITGVLKAMEFEIEGYIKHYRSLYPDLAVIISGGDASYFENKFNTPIFTKDSLVLVGLNRVLEYHVA